jgi:aspartyl/asparaginyl-tRNA synthetase
MTELTMLDIEMGFVDSHDEVMALVGDMTMSVVRDVYAAFADELKSLNSPELKLPEGKIPEFTIAEIHDMYTKATKTDTTDEKDLTPDEERWIADYARKELGSDFVYARDFPAEAGKFYHKFKNDGTVAWADLLYRGLEIATVPLRENHYNKMVEQMKRAGLDVTAEGYKYYLQAFQFGLPQHGGCGFGIDRLVQKTIGLGNVKEATLFPRDINRLTF